MADTFTWQLASKQGVSAPCRIFIALQNRNRLNFQEHTQEYDLIDSELRKFR